MALSTRGFVGPLSFSIGGYVLPVPRVALGSPTRRSLQVCAGAYLGLPAFPKYIRQFSRKRNTPKRSSNRRPLSPYGTPEAVLGFQAAFHFCSNRVSHEHVLTKRCGVELENRGNG